MPAALFPAMMALALQAEPVPGRPFARIRTMIAAGAVHESELVALEADLDLARTDPSIGWEYHAVQMVCRPGPA